MPKTPKVILWIDVTTEYGRALVRGIAQYSRLHGPWVFYKKPLSYRDPNWDKNIFERLQNWKADGVILREPGEIKPILNLALPTIISPYNRELIPGYPHIIGDPAKIAQLAAEHLFERGFRHFACCGFESLPFSRNRCKNFREILRNAGFEVHVYQQPKKRTKRLWENEETVLAEWLKSLPKPIGVMTCNDDRGDHVLQACKKAGLTVPDEVAVVGVGNDPLICELSTPPLSSVATAGERAGYEAAALLARLMDGEEMADQRIIVPTKYVVTRQSTDILSIDDHEVVMAVHFIRCNAARAISVSDVAEEVSLSRRELERRFRRFLGRTIHREIRRARVQQLARMLAETNLSISHIACELGYTSAKHLSRCFRQEMGMTPLNYRKYCRV